MLHLKNNLVSVSFEVSNNIASIRFYSKTAMITKVAAQTKWTNNKIQQYHLLLSAFIDAINELNFSTDIEEITIATNASFTPEALDTGE